MLNLQCKNNDDIAFDSIINQSKKVLKQSNHCQIPNQIVKIPQFCRFMLNK